MSRQVTVNHGASQPFKNVRWLRILQFEGGATIMQKEGGTPQPIVALCGYVADPTDPRKQFDDTITIVGFAVVDVEESAGGDGYAGPPGQQDTSVGSVLFDSISTPGGALDTRTIAGVDLDCRRFDDIQCYIFQSGGAAGTLLSFAIAEDGTNIPMNGGQALSPANWLRVGFGGAGVSRDDQMVPTKMRFTIAGIPAFTVRLRIEAR